MGEGSSSVPARIPARNWATQGEALERDDWKDGQTKGASTVWILGENDNCAAFQMFREVFPTSFSSSVE